MKQATFYFTVLIAKSLAVSVAVLTVSFIIGSLLPKLFLL